MTFYYKDKNGDNKWHELPAIEPMEITGEGNEENLEHLKNSNCCVSLTINIFSDKIPSRVLHLAVHHKDVKVRKRNQKRIWNKYHKKILKGKKRI